MSWCRQNNCPGIYKDRVGLATSCVVATLKLHKDQNFSPPTPVSALKRDFCMDDIGHMLIGGTKVNTN